MSDEEENFYLSDGEIDDIAQDAYMVLDEVNEGELVDVDEQSNTDIKVVEKTAAVVNVTKDYDRFSFHNDIQAHPYSDIIENFQFQERQLKSTVIAPRENLSETPLHVIESRVSLIKLLQSLRNANEIAVDLLGDTKRKEIYILSVSTEEADYIIDVCTLKNEVLLLNEIFINPEIVKIFHKSHLQLSQLQQNLCLYVINIFDVEKAGEVIFGADQPPFDEVLQRNFSVTRDSTQLGDLSQRPIPEKTKVYCRSASHFLINLYHNYKNQLLAKDIDKYKNFLNECREQCKVLHDVQDVEDFAILEEKIRVRHQAEMKFLRKMFEWRQNLALQLGLNPGIIVKTTNLLRLASHLPLKIEDFTFWLKTQYIKKYRYDILKIVTQIRKELSLAYVNEKGKVIPAVYKLTNKPSSNISCNNSKKRKFEGGGNWNGKKKYFESNSVIRGLPGSSSQSKTPYFRKKAY